MLDTEKIFNLQENFKKNLQKNNLLTQHSMSYPPDTIQLMSMC